MNKNTLNNFFIPQELKNAGLNGSLTDWENNLLSHFSSSHDIFTPYPDYFKLRTYEFRVLRQLLPKYFDRQRKYELLLEVGCNFGYKSMLLSSYAKKILAIDIPESYEGCHLGEFERTTDIAKIFVNEKMGMDQVEFKNMWPHELTIASESVDCIFTEYVLEHIPDLSKAIKEMHRVLKKDGVMIHTVPNTNDAIRVFIEANTHITFGKLFKIFKSQMGVFLKGQSRNQSSLRLNGIVVPPCHSEHIRDFSKQLDIYTLENYLFPMLECGLTIEHIISTRENNHVIIVRKNQ